MAKALFTPCEAVFDSLLDVAEVDQFGYVDLRQAFLTGTVQGNLAPDDVSFNGIDDPNGILPAARDVFEATRQAQYADTYGKSKTKSQPAAPAAPSTEGEGASSAAAE